MKIVKLQQLMKIGALALLLTGTVQGQTLLVGNLGVNTVSAYNGNTGSVVPNAFLTGLSGPYDLTHDDNYIYVANVDANTVGKYDRLTGAVVDPAFITGLGQPLGIAYHDNLLFISNNLSSTVALYDATTGDLITNALVTGLNVPRLLEVHDGKLYVPTSGDGVVGVYGLDGTPIEPLFISGYAGAFGLAFSDDSLFVTTSSSNSVAQFNALTGEVIDANFLTGLANPVGIVADGAGHLIVAELQANISRYTTGGTLVDLQFVPNGGLTVGLDYLPVPEPSTYALVGVGLLGWMIRRRNRRRCDAGNR